MTILEYSNENNSSNIAATVGDVQSYVPEYNEIGSVAFCYTSASASPGTIVSGSSLYYTAINSAVNYMQTTQNNVGIGTWMCTGYYTSTSFATTWVRIL